MLAALLRGNMNGLLHANGFSSGKSEEPHLMFLDEVIKLLSLWKIPLTDKLVKITVTF